MTADAVPTLLLVDDEPANLDLLEAILGGAGVGTLLRTQDPLQAVEMAREHVPDLVLLDLHMPRMSGFEVLRELRGMTPEGDYRPVLVLTADITSEARDRALGEGARDFLTKPFDVGEVLLRVQNLLETRRLYLAQREARVAAESAALRATLLSEASRALGASLDSATALEQLARILVPRMAELCVIELGEGDGTTVRAIAHADPAAEARLRSFAGSGSPLAPLLGRARTLTLPRLPAQFGETGLAFMGVEPQSLVSTPLRAGGRVIGALTMISFSPERRYLREDQALAEELAGRAALALENARLFADARRATEARERILSIVAHDLRNPLASIAMGAEMALHLMPPRSPAYARETLAGIQASATQVHRLVEDLLDVGRLEATDAPLQTADLFAMDLLEQAEAMLRPLAAGRGLELRMECDEELRVHADSVRVIQVLSNLVGNAIKFTPSGGSITVRTEPAEGMVRVSVIDTGPGIPAEHLPHLFGAFWQADPADRRGAGLGLSIASALVAAHGGRMWVESELDVGTTVHFTLPAPRAAAASPSPSPDSEGYLVMERTSAEPARIEVEIDG
ncbi:MAG TPA: ATP-binding protein [Longimicrobium sp.]|jgi:signal transduction histidine kinase|uniref:ATP-binding protein n=1 Tax=Longimicrobium sp. TaxID=2029185 RepID=UPI002ED7E6E9